MPFNKMPIEFIVRNHNGCRWYSQTGSNAEKRAICACLDNKNLTELAREMLTAFCNKLPSDIYIIKINNELKLQSIRTKRRVTISLKYPLRQATAVGFNLLALHLSKDSIIETVEDVKKNMFFEQDASIDVKIMARAALYKSDKHCTDIEIKAVVSHIVQYGKLPHYLE